MVVPTAGTRTQLLDDLVASCGIPRDRVVVVTTAPFVAWPDGVQRVEDLGPVNIHRWWNAGIAVAEASGATHVAVCNDDIAIDAHTIPAMVDAMRDTGAVLACPSTRDPGRVLHDVDPLMDAPPRRVLDGACWVLDLAAPLRPDESYRWWCGDNELDFTARRHLGGVVTVGSVVYRHVHPSEATFSTPALGRLAEQDLALFRSRWLQGVPHVVQ